MRRCPACGTLMDRVPKGDCKPGKCSLEFVWLCPNCKFIQEE